MSLDGYVANNDDTADWMQNIDEDWKDLFTDLDQTDTYLLGRKMYPVYSKYWQGVFNKPEGNGKYEVEFAKLADKTQHIVFTKGEFKPDWENTRVAHDVKQEIANLKKQPGKNIIAWGGANFAANLINLGLVDEIRILIAPVILGEGKSLVKGINQRSDLELIKSEQAKGAVILRYKLKS
jgi:dihydrofolate reductase